MNFIKNILRPCLQFLLPFFLYFLTTIKSSHSTLKKNYSNTIITHASCDTKGNFIFYNFFDSQKNLHQLTIYDVTQKKVHQTIDILCRLFDNFYVNGKGNALALLFSHTKNKKIIVNYKKDKNNTWIQSKKNIYLPDAISTEKINSIIMCNKNNIIAYGTPNKSVYLFNTLNINKYTTYNFANPVMRIELYNKTKKHNRFIRINTENENIIFDIYKKKIISIENYAINNQLYAIDQHMVNYNLLQSSTLYAEYLYLNNIFPTIFYKNKPNHKFITFFHYCHHNCLSCTNLILFNKIYQDTKLEQYATGIIFKSPEKIMILKIPIEKLTHNAIN